MTTTLSTRNSERAIAASVLLHPDWWPLLVSISPEDDISRVFFDEEVALVVRAIDKAHKRFGFVRLDNVVDILESGDDVETIFGENIDVKDHLTALIAAGGFSSEKELRRNFEHLGEEFFKRSRISHVESLLANYHSGAGRDLEVKDIDDQLTQITLLGSTKVEIKKIGQAIQERRAANQSLASWTLTTGIKELDDLTKGLEPGRVYVVAARPKVGKTTLAINLAREALTEGAHVLFYSKEMPLEEIYAKFISTQSWVSHTTVSDLFSGKISERDVDEEELERIKDAEKDFENANLVVVESHEAPHFLDFVRITSSYRMEIGEDVPLLVINDYLQLWVEDTRNANSEIENMTKKHKLHALEHKYALVLLSQLNRGKDEGEMANVQNLRGSGAIEQDADQVWLLNRKAVANRQRREEGLEEYPEHIMDISLAAARNASGGREIAVWYAGDTSSIMSLSEMNALGGDDDKEDHEEEEPSRRERRSSRRRRDQESSDDDSQEEKPTRSRRERRSSRRSRSEEDY